MSVSNLAILRPSHVIIDRIQAFHGTVRLHHESGEQNCSPKTRNLKRHLLSFFPARKLGSSALMVQENRRF